MSIEKNMVTTRSQFKTCIRKLEFEKGETAKLAHNGRMNCQYV